MVTEGLLLPHGVQRSSKQSGDTNESAHLREEMEAVLLGTALATCRVMFNVNYNVDSCGSGNGGILIA